MRPLAVLAFLLPALSLAQDGSVSGPTSSSQAAKYSCDPSVCKLPKCNCASTSPPGGLSPVITRSFALPFLLPLASGARASPKFFRRLASIFLWSKLLILLVGRPTSLNSSSIPPTMLYNPTPLIPSTNFLRTV